MSESDLYRQWAEDSAEFRAKTTPRWNPESYRVAEPKRLAHPPSFKKGGKVKKTGLALVHKGERVLTKRAAAILAKKTRRRRKTRQLKDGLSVSQKQR